MKIKIPEWHSYKDQFCRLGKHEWKLVVLLELSKDLEVFDLPMAALNIYHNYEKLTLREMVMHFNAVMNADLNYPIILDEDGEIMDGRHRIMKALYEGRETIKAVRFEKNPDPCEIYD